MVDKRLMLIKPEARDKRLMLIKPEARDKRLMLIQPEARDKRLMLIKPEARKLACRLYRHNSIDNTDNSATNHHYTSNA